MDVKPPARLSALEFEVKYNDGKISLIETSVVDLGGGGNSVTLDRHHGGTEVDVVLEARSQDGLLNEVLKIS